jgi:hypothetical protein
MVFAPGSMLMVGVLLTETDGTLRTVTGTSPVVTPPWPSLTATRTTNAPLSVVGQLPAPLAASMVAPGGDGGTSAKLSGLAGRSGSVADAVKLTVAPSLTVNASGTTSTGGRFTSSTWIANDF